MARREYIDGKTGPPSSTIVETADRLLRLLEDGDCVDTRHVAEEFGVGLKTVRAALDWLRDSRIIITLMDGERCWLGRRGYAPDWDQITIGQASQMGLLAPWELRRLRAARTFQFPRLSNPGVQSDWRSTTLGDAVDLGTLTVREATRICCAARYETARIKEKLLG
jgi:hypothetical protein